LNHFLEKRFNNDKLTTKVADMEKLPFADQSFDLIVSAGSLSYGDNDKVLDEIYKNSVFSPIPAPISKTLVDSSTYS
jgi:hypothetical protein